VVHESGVIGVVARNEFAAGEALNSLRAEWKEVPQSGVATLYEDLKKPAGEGGGRGGSGGGGSRGSIEQGLTGAAKTVEATYKIAYIAHAPLEPRAAVAEWIDGSLTVWTGTQRPFGVKSELASSFGL